MAETALKLYFQELHGSFPVLALERHCSFLPGFPEVDKLCQSGKDEASFSVFFFKRFIFLNSGTERAAATQMLLLGLTTYNS